MAVTPPVTLVALGDWPAARLHARLGESGFALPAALMPAVAAAWTAAQRPGVDLFDGGMLRLERALAEADGLHLDLSRTSYRLFIGTNVAHPQWGDDHGRVALADPLGTSVALRSSDGMLVFGRRSERVALYAGHAHPFGGTMEVVDTASPDVLAEMARELAEEVHLTPADLTDLRVIGLIEDQRLRQPELVYAAQATLTAADIVARLDRHEHSACWLVDDDPASLAQALVGREPLTPVLLGTLLAWGRYRHGEAWLDTQLARTGAARQPLARWG